MTGTRQLLAVLAGLAAANTAAAGPMRWGWTSSRATATGLGVLRATSPDDPGLGYLVRYAPVTESDPGPITAATGTIGLGGFRFAAAGPDAWTPDAGTAPADDRFRITLTAHDFDTGLSAGRDFVGTLGYRRQAGEVVPVVTFVEPRAAWEVGNHRVEVELSSVYTRLFDPPAMLINSHWAIDQAYCPPPPPCPTVPEPATLALAGLGLAAVGVRRLRR